MPTLARISSFRAITMLLVVIVLLLLTVAFLNTTILKELRNQGSLRAVDRFDVWAIGDSYKIQWDGTLATIEPPSGYKAQNAVWNAATSTISLTGMKNEVLGVQIVTETTGGDVTGIDFALSPLVKGADTIPQNNLTLFFEHFIQSPYNPLPLRPGGALPRRYYADALIPFYNPEFPAQRIVNPFPLTGSLDAQPIWLDIAIPKTAVAGTYTGTITISGTDADPTTLTLSVTVLDAELPDAQNLTFASTIKASSFAGTFSGYGSYSLQNPNFGSLWALTEKFLDAAQTHRMTFNFNTLLPDYTADPDGGVSNINWSTYDAFLGAYLQENGVPKGWQLPGRQIDVSGPTMTQADRNYWSDWAPEIVSHYVTKGWPVADAFVWSTDEPDEASEYPAIKEFGTLLHTTAPTLKHMVTEGMHGGDLFGYVDWFFQPARDYYPQQVATAPAGTRSWFYQYSFGEPMSGLHTINTDALAFRTWPWIARKYGVEGMYYWATTNWDDDGAANPYLIPDDNPTDQGEGSGVLFYPGNKLTIAPHPDPSYNFAANFNGPVPSIRLKNIRRGMQDEALFEMADALGEQAYVDGVVNSLVVSALCRYYNLVTEHCPGTQADPRWTDDGGIPPGIPEWEKNPDLWHTAVDDVRAFLADLLAPEPPCEESWVCDAVWGECIDGLQTRVCSDENECGTEVLKPATSQACAMPCVENWTCDSEWSSCVDGAQSRTCTDLNACGTFVLRPDLTQSCILPCVEHWDCTGFSSCVDGTQTQSCLDRNDCGTTLTRPPLSQSCTACQEHWVCDDAWSVCVDGVQNRSCQDANGCGTTTTQPPLSQSCAIGGPTDTDAPDTALTQPPQPVLKKYSTTVSWTGSDAVTETPNLYYTWRLDNGVWSAFRTDTTTTLTGLAKGSHTFTVKALDEAGNEDPTPATSTFAVKHNPVIVTAPTTGSEPRVRVYGPDGRLVRSFLAFEKGFRGGAHVAVGDLGHDGAPEIVVAAGAGRKPEVKIFSLTGNLITKFTAFTESFRGGVSVAIGDVNGGDAEIVVAPAGAGGPSVRVFSWQSGAYAPLAPSFRAYKKTFRGGMSVAVTDLDGNGTGEIVTVPLSGGGPELRVFGLRGKTFRQVYSSTFVFETGFRGGVSLANTDMNGDGKSEIVVAPASGRTSTLRIIERSREGRLTLRPERMTAFHIDFTGGVSLATVDTDGDGKTEVVASVKHGGKPSVRLFTPTLDSLTKEFFGASKRFLDGLSIAGGN